jgi:hypothetical protein
MQLGIGSHLEDTELEQYSMGTLSDTRLEAFEEHLLACDTCQDQLLEMEAYVNAMRSVSPKLREAPRSSWADLFRWPRSGWVAAFAAGVFALAMTRVWLAVPPARVEMASVFLYSSRGIDGLAAAQAPAHTPLSLTLDLTELPVFTSYRLEIVGESGKPVWEAMAHPQDRKIVEPTRKGLSEGQYFVRLYAPAGELLREFSLRIR